MMSGYKKDSTCWLNPLMTIGSKKTKFCFPGDPETGWNWTEYKYSYTNCNKDTTNANYELRIPGDRGFC